MVEPSASAFVAEDDEQMAQVLLFENFGHHQLVLLWRLQGFWRWMVGAPSKWGDMKRSASWQKEL